MKKIISIAVILLTLVALTMPILAEDPKSPQAPPHNVVENDKKVSDVTESTDEAFKTAIQQIRKDEGDGGVIVVEVNYNYASTDDSGDHSIHNLNEGSKFYYGANGVETLLKSKYDSAKEKCVTSVVDIHVWVKGNIKNVSVPIPSTIVVPADVKSGDKVVVYHQIGNDIVEHTDFTVSDGKITLNNITSLSLWSFTKIVPKETGGSGNTGYIPPRTDVK